MSETPAPTPKSLLPVVVALVTGVLLYAAVRLDEMPATRAATLYAFGAATGWFLQRFHATMQQEGWPGMETHWGGLGGGLGGWRVSPSVVYLMGALSFGGLLAYSVPQEIEVPVEVEVPVEIEVPVQVDPPQPQTPPPAPPPPAPLPVDPAPAQLVQPDSAPAPAAATAEGP